MQPIWKRQLRIKCPSIEEQVLKYEGCFEGIWTITTKERHCFSINLVEEQPQCPRLLIGCAYTIVEGIKDAT
jgi:hypothetical protein